MKKSNAKNETKKHLLLQLKKEIHFPTVKFIFQICGWWNQKKDLPQKLGKHQQQLIQKNLFL